MNKNLKASLKGSRVSEPARYYIQNKSTFVGNCVLWWCVDGQGYTVDIDQAWSVTKEQASHICSSRPDQDIPWSVKLIDKLARRHVDAQTLPREEKS